MPRNIQDVPNGCSTEPGTMEMARTPGTGSPATVAIRSTRHAPTSPPMKLNSRSTKGGVALMSERAALEVQPCRLLLVGFLDAHRVLLERGLARIRVQQAQRETVHAI